ncbi:SDR family oxidoreductase [Pollutibacter soli]|uniref:SDR family oxidoreductase n=1 Tax=Pollutibacter soli TaxID=3034157 RepID=UPI00301362C2
MKIVLTGSIGNIGKPLTGILVKNRHDVKVITSKKERVAQIEALGAKAAIGRMEDADFLAASFSGADIVYCMETMESAGGLLDSDIDIFSAINIIGNSYRKAIETCNIKRVVHLSSVGAHTNKGIGILEFHYNVEQILRQLPEDVSIKTIRPVGFYSNLFSHFRTISAYSSIISNYGGDTKEPWVSTTDIAEVIAEEIEKPFDGRTVRYIASDEVSPNEIAKSLGQAIGIPDLQWKIISDKEMIDGLLATGMNLQAAKGFTEMQAGPGNGPIYEDYNKNIPVLRKIKLKDLQMNLQSNTINTNNNEYNK